jgi:hypothetical protein
VPLCAHAVRSQYLEFERICLLDVMSGAWNEPRISGPSVLLRIRGRIHLADIFLTFMTPNVTRFAFRPLSHTGAF